MNLKNIIVRYCFKKNRIGKFHKMIPYNFKQRKIISSFIFLLSLIYCQADILSKTELHIINGNKYISILEYASAHQIPTIFYEEKEKIEFRFETFKLLISPHSSFIKINEIIYHLYLPIVFDGNDFFIPIKPFFQIINNLGISNFRLDSSEKYILTSIPNYNVKSISIINKQNGTVIIIDTKKLFPRNVLSASITNGGWLNVTITGAKIDSSGLANSPLYHPISRIRLVQSKESAQISFLLKSKVDDFEIESNKDHISITLRTSLAENADKIREMRNRWLLDTIVIDPGHGGKDPGAVGVGGIQEKTVNLDIARKLGALIESNLGIKVIYTRDEDVFIPLWERTQIANESSGKLFISIHANSAYKNHGIRGFETYLLRPGKTKDAIQVAQRENDVIKMEEKYHTYEKLSNDKLILYTMAQSSFMKESEFLAAEIQKEMDKVLTSPNRGVKQAGFHVLVGASMPNVLIETGFLSNKIDAKLLGRSKYRKKVALAIFEALVNFKNKYESPIIGEK